MTLSVHRLGRAHQKPDLSEPRAAVEKRLLEAAMSVLPPPEEVAALDALVRAVSEVLTGSGLCSEVRPAGHFAKGTMLRDTWATEVAAVLREPPASLDTLRATLARLHLALASDAALQPYQVEVSPTALSLRPLIVFQLDPEGTNLIIAAREGRANAAVCVGWLVPAEGPSMRMRSVPRLHPSLGSLLQPPIWRVHLRWAARGLCALLRNRCGWR